MATSTIPASNPAGNNQMSPVTGGIKPLATTGPVAGAPGSIQQNPFIPIAPGSVIPGAGGTVPGTASSSMQAAPGGVSSLQKQETDIYGQGIGQSLTDLLSGIGGTDSATLEEFIKSLAPQEAKAEANLGSSLGAMGVGGNSSVAALGEANFQGDMFSAISGEAAQLTQSGQNLEASILTGQQQDASAEVSSSGWDVFGQVAGAVGNLAGDVLGAGGIGNIIPGKKKV